MDNYCNENSKSTISQASLFSQNPTANFMLCRMSDADDRQNWHFFIASPPFSERKKTNLNDFTRRDKRGEQGTELDLQKFSKVVLDNASPPTAGLGAAAGSTNAGPAPAPPPEWRMRQWELRGQEGKEEEAASGARGHRVDTTGLRRGSGGAGEAPASERRCRSLRSFGWIMLNSRGWKNGGS